MSVCWYPINVKYGWTDQAQYLWGNSRDPRNIYGCFELQNFENPRKNIIRSANFFACYCFIMYKKRCSQIEPKLKFYMEDGCEAP